MEQLLRLDASLLLWIQEHLRFEALTPVMKCISLMGNAGIIWILMTAVFLLYPKTRRVGILCTGSLLLNALLCNVLLKNLVARPRPYTRISDLILLIDPATDYSFPSGHTSAAFSVAVILLLTMPKKVSIPVLLLALAMGFSRLYLGIHYPGDVLGGMLLGTFCALIIYRYRKNIPLAH